MIDQVVEPGDIRPFDRSGDPRELVGPGQRRVALHRLPEVADDGQARFTVADDEQVDVGGEQLGVLGSGAAGDDERVVGRTVLGLERDAAKVEHGQDVRIANLILEREAEDVELPERGEGLQRIERQAVLAEGGFEVGERCKGSLARPIAGVHQAVEDLEPVVAHAEGVGVGERQAEGSLASAMVLADAVELAAKVLGRGSDVG